MARVFYVHWHAAELRERTAALEAAGHEVLGHAAAGQSPRLGDFQPEAVVLSLDRLPSHGLAVAEWWRESPRRRAVPLIFAGGKPDKVEAARLRFPDARFCPTDEVPGLLAASPAACPSPGSASG